LIMRLAMISLTKLSTNAVEVGSPIAAPDGVMHPRLAGRPASEPTPTNAMTGLVVSPGCLGQRGWRDDLRLMIQSLIMVLLNRNVVAARLH
jgi:hypothetical protein